MNERSVKILKFLTLRMKRTKIKKANKARKLIFDLEYVKTK